MSTCVKVWYWAIFSADSTIGVVVKSTQVRVSRDRRWASTGHDAPADQTSSGNNLSPVLVIGRAKSSVRLTPQRKAGPQRSRQPDRESAVYGRNGIGGGHDGSLPPPSVGMNAKHDDTVLVRLVDTPCRRFSLGESCRLSCVSAALLYRLAKLHLLGVIDDSCGKFRQRPDCFRGVPPKRLIFAPRFRSAGIIEAPRESPDRLALIGEVSVFGPHFSTPPQSTNQRRQ